MSDSLTAEKALEFVEDLLVRQSGRRLSEDEKAIFRGSWEGLTYEQIRGKFNIYTHIVDVRRTGGQLWNTIAKLFKLPLDEVTKKTFPGLVEQQWKLRQQTPPPLIESPESESPQPDGLTSEGFVGREQALADLDELRAAGATCILIQSPGGVGKTVLAERYLSQRFQKQIVRFDIGKETENISSAEGLIEQKLRDLGEEPGREFMVSCDRLRSKLQAEALPVLVDNLEPALNENGRLIETHRSYVELFRVLSDPSSKSLTLITSRERVCENLNIRLYRLSHLSLEAWQEYFAQTHLDSDTPVMAEIHQAYRGNALAMKVLRERITLDYSGQIEEYWESNQTEDGVSVETDVENLIFEQFERLAMVDVNAYHLLCRMGCFRYQDVPAVPRDGLLCLLWELPPKRKLKVIEALCDRALVERVDGEYKLHPLIREEAVERLRNSEDWEKANSVAAEFWNDSVKNIKNTRHASKALEAAFHYLKNDDHQKAAEVICKKRPYTYSQDLLQGVSPDATLGSSFIRLGISEKVDEIIHEITSHIPRNYFASKLHNLLGDICWVKGDVKGAIENHLESGRIATNLLESESDKYYLIESKIYDILCFFNVGICKIDVGEFEEGLTYLNKVVSKTKDSELLSGYSMRALCNMASSLAFLGNTQAAAKTVAVVESNLESIKLGVRSTAYRLYHLGKTFQYLGDTRKSFIYYEKSLKYSRGINFLQGAAVATMGIGEVYRTKSNFSKSLFNHDQAIHILQKINAKCDLAEAYYQLALTYQAMDDRPNSRLYFQKALTLWERIDAPKQIERVRQSMESGRISDLGG
jgi:tetratricopeptide (TPR) repeat protein